jgi:hypothetical protein
VGRNWQVRRRERGILEGVVVLGGSVKADGGGKVLQRCKYLRRRKGLPVAIFSMLMVLAFMTVLISTTT